MDLLENYRLGAEKTRLKMIDQRLKPINIRKYSNILEIVLEAKHLDCQSEKV